MSSTYEDEEEKWCYIKLINQYYGNSNCEFLIMRMLTYYHKPNVYELTNKEVREFYLSLMR